MSMNSLGVIGIVLLAMFLVVLGLVILFWRTKTCCFEKKGGAGPSTTRPSEGLAGEPTTTRPSGGLAGEPRPSEGFVITRSTTTTTGPPRVVTDALGNRTTVTTTTVTVTRRAGGEPEIQGAAAPVVVDAVTPSLSQKDETSGAPPPSYEESQKMGHPSPSCPPPNYCKSPTPPSYKT